MTVRAIAFAFICSAASLPSASLGEQTEDGGSEERSDSRFTREMSTDRPDLTESPYSVEKGRTQVEIEAVSHGSETSDGVEVTSTGLAGFLIKRGIHRNADIQFGTSQLFRATDFEFDRTLHPGEIDVSDNTGPGDLQIRLKWNFWGNDGGRTAFALMPFVDLPTSRDSPGGAVEGGLIAPLAIEGPVGFGFGVMGEVDWFDVQGVRWTEWLSTATASHDIAGGLGGFVEFAATFRVPDEGEWLGLFNTGITFAITPNTQLDGGVRLGVTDVAPDYEAFLGFSFRQ
ncbi:MAG TPA: transporter [Candidatus Eisenbacteria bacterium]|nr:transporter [Candidatus Eisenbacteria bacterium]